MTRPAALLDASAITRIVCAAHAGWVSAYSHIEIDSLSSGFFIRIMATTSEMHDRNVEKGTLQ
jgi:hypothetical protein